jgi:hypothetical protein
MPPETPQSVAVASATAAILGTIASLGFASAWHRLRGTTLAAPAVWALAASMGFALVELTIAWRPHLAAAFGAALARYAAAVGSFCPFMAVLGAKRPQDRAWQWVVASLWIVLLVPAVQFWAAGGGGPIALAAPWWILIAALMSLEVVSYLPTRNALPALFAACGQAALFAPYALDAPLGIGVNERIAAGTAILLAMMPSEWRRRRRSTAPQGGTDQLARFDERWLALRDGWSAFWGLRLLQRINESAELGDWPVRLDWQGFSPVGSAAAISIDQRLVSQIEQTMNSLLWRFERREAPTTIRY